MSGDAVYRAATAVLEQMTGRKFCAYCRQEKPVETVKLIKNRWCCAKCRERRGL